MVHLPSLGVSDGILIASYTDFFDIDIIPCASTYSISVRISSKLEDEIWDLTGVYGPQPENDKMIFISELRNIHNMIWPEWVILGHFNMIRRARQKNKGPINRRVMRQFNNTIDNLHLLELNLNGWAFTWINGHNDPIMTRIGRFPPTTEWHDLFPSADLQSVCTMTSDHCPLIKQGRSSFCFYKGFRFEVF